MKSDRHNSAHPSYLIHTVLGKQTETGTSSTDTQHRYRHDTVKKAAWLESEISNNRNN